MARRSHKRGFLVEPGNGASSPCYPIHDEEKPERIDVWSMARPIPPEAEEFMPITTEDTLAWLQQLTVVLHENRAYLTQLDSAIGDADHGINMDRGFKAVAEKLA